MTKKFKLTVEMEYEADPKYYSCDNATEMAQIDEKTFNNDANLLFDMLDSFVGEYKVKVEVVDVVDD